MISSQILEDLELNRYWNHRTLCDVLSEMRECYKTRNFSHLNGLIEEAQCYGNQMEASLEYKKDLIEMKQEWSGMKNKLKEMDKLIPKDSDEQEDK